MKNDTSVVPVRGVPDVIRFHEQYTYSQDESVEARVRQTQTPSGILKIDVPQDGRLHIRDETMKDISRTKNGASDRARIGHLLLSSADAVGSIGDDVGHRFNGQESAIAIPVDVPAPSVDGEGMHLGEGKVAVLEVDYQPAPLKIIPITVDLELADVVTDHQKSENDRNTGSGTKKRVRTLQFDVPIRLTLSVRVIVEVLTYKSDVERLRCPLTMEMGLNWPNVASLKSVDFVDTVAVVNDQIQPHLNIKDIRYNPTTRRLEWGAMRRVKPSIRGNEQIDTNDEGPSHLANAVIDETWIFIIDLHQPGEFAALDVMSGHVQIALDGMICTGLAPTFVDAQGGFIPCRNRLSKNGASSSSATPLPSSVLNRFKDSITVEKRSTISSDFAFSLDDVFQNRELKPYFKLHFDEIIPSEARDRDVTSALKARGFMCTDVTDKYKPDHQTDHFTVIQATRKVGLDEMKIVVAISGERSITQREKKGEGISVMTNMDSGELIIQVLGVIPRNDQSLIKEMNSVHRTLHNTFKYVRSQR